MGAQKWRRLRRAYSFARRHQDPLGEPKRFRAIVEEMHQRVHAAESRRTAKQLKTAILNVIQEAKTQQLIERLEKEM
ncbi:hypothetical protein [Pseudoclavibacter sp. CFCC 11306]|uniref:hypothetical protein n=1 Tax=Pseudoclavibacter sp. CFCC 11306 TaxID=1564493 RepID=UPI0013015D70|nr:hypothetical protein [Pseudoclavibacter sp. CFCC 11306]KAB1658984.1 hypothetical protein F8O09_05305 [Pseudoclavibacter sp. CFCC 11306]